MSSGAKLDSIHKRIAVQLFNIGVMLTFKKISKVGLADIANNLREITKEIEQL